MIALPKNISRLIDGGVELRGASRDDLPEILALLSQLHDRDAPLSIDDRLTSTFTDILSSPARIILVALLEDRLVGTLDLSVMANLTRAGRPWAVIENVVVDHDSRRRGVGRAMIDVAAEVAREVGCYKLQLVSHERRDAADALYRATGFTAPVRGYRRYLDK
jgi:GNAT superfamily N-acetyltransferase